MNENIIDNYNQMMLDDIDNDEDLYLEEPKNENGEVVFDDEIGDFSNDEYIHEPEEDQIQQPQQKPVCNNNNQNEYDNQLNIGILVELEHIHWWTDEDPNLDNDIVEQIATNIAIDHIKQTPDYYTKLIKAGLVDEKDALDLYKSIYGNEVPTKTKSLPIPNVRSCSEIGNAYKVKLESTPTPIEQKQIIPAKNIMNYEDMLNENNFGSSDVPTGFDVNFDEIEID
jgi:hypothetical protein